ncbi:MAG: 4Fe-4S binding protein [Deltaproteobacteria bacterium]|nr:4Fe-4S binding protein [Deltaproteobacteria bacterium]
MLKITRIKLAVQIIATSIIVYLGYWVTQMISWKSISLTLPTLSCYYLDHRIASCYLRSLQETLSAGWSVKYTNVIAPTILLLIFGLIVGRAWCAWVCPVGLVQDVFTYIRKFLKASYYNLPEKLKVTAAIVKWSMLFALVFISVGITIPNFFLSVYQMDLFTPFCQICPSREIAPVFTGNFQKMWAYDDMSTISKVMSYLAMGVFIFYLLTTSFIRRMWCRLCPMGALLGLLNRISFLSLRKEGVRCTKCGVCLRACPVQVKEVYEEKKKERLTTHDCTLCLRCVEMCPQDKTLRASFFKKTIVTSTYKRFLKSGAVGPISDKRRNLQ